MAIDAAEMTTGPSLFSRERGRARCVSSRVGNSRCRKAEGKRRECHLHLHLHVLSPGVLISAFLLLLRGDAVAAPSPLVAFAAGPYATRPAVLGRCNGFSAQGTRDNRRAAARTARCGACLMAAAGGDKEEEKMELAAEVCFCRGCHRGGLPAHACAEQRCMRAFVAVRFEAVSDS